MSLAPNKIFATLRASAALPAAGAYDAAGSTGTALAEATEVELYVTYTRGAAGGRCKLKILVSHDNIHWFERTIDEGATTVTGGEGVSNLDTSAKQLPAAAGATAERRTYILRTLTAGWFQALFAETGNTGTPGTVLCECVIGVR